jgi:hypothetical protein
MEKTKTVKSLSLIPERIKWRVGQPSKVEGTKDYDKFVFKRGNRPVRRRVVSLMQAIEKHNQLTEYPILVSERQDGKLEIADGQHRFEAAKALKVTIFYIKSRQPLTIEQIAAANQLQKTWTLQDWLDSWIGRGNAEYMKLKDFCETFHLPVTVGLEVIGRSYGGEQGLAFKQGKFKVEDFAFGQTVAHTLSALRGHIPVADLRLVRALIRVLKVNGISIDRLIKKLIAHSSMFERQASWVKYVEMIERIYNKHVHAHERVAVTFEVDQLERAKRSTGAVKANQTRRERREQKVA